MAITVSEEPDQAFYCFWHDHYIHQHGSEPTVITVYRVSYHCTKADQTGDWYEHCFPIENVCVFSKKQTVRELQRLFNYYENIPEKEYNIALRSKWGEPYSHWITAEAIENDSQ